jgi:hypothetical protein
MKALWSSASNLKPQQVSIDWEPSHLSTAFFFYISGRDHWEDYAH